MENCALCVREMREVEFQILVKLFRSALCVELTPGVSCISNIVRYIAQLQNYLLCDLPPFARAPILHMAIELVLL
jgi:hypothetical protein